MNKNKAFAKARESWAEEIPARIEAMSIEDGILCIVAHETNTCIVVYHERDLERLKNMCQMLLANLEEKP